MNAPRYDHLQALTDHNGVFEHALMDAPRRERGYCVDDVSRALIVVVREPDQTIALAQHAQLCLRFLESALDEDGRVHNRMSADGEWTDEPTMGDWWGRLIWALGTTAARGSDPFTRVRALRGFRLAARQRPVDLRSAAFAALGAAEVAAVYTGDRAARAVFVDLLAMIPSTMDDSWYWPEPRLAYANASIPEALIAAGLALGEGAAARQGLRMLRFLLDLEITADRLSVTGTGGRGPGEHGPLFDQQPLEVAAIADACARAFDATGDAEWLRPVELAWLWFTGRNDSETVMIDPETGAGFDGLRRDGRNENRGAESTLSALSTQQQALRLAALVP